VYSSIVEVEISVKPLESSLFKRLTMPESLPWLPKREWNSSIIRTDLGIDFNSWAMFLIRSSISPL
jgi:hypothetical protein